MAARPISTVEEGAVSQDYLGHMTVTVCPVTADPADLKAVEGKEATSRPLIVMEAVERMAPVELAGQAHRVGEVGEGTMGAGEDPGRAAEVGLATRAGLSASTLRLPIRETALYR